MAELPILNAVTPETIPAKTYDRVWIEEVIIRGPDPNMDISGQVKLRKYGMFDGVAEFEPGNGQWIRVNNMLEKSESSPSLQAAMVGIVAYVTELGVENQIVDPPSE
tara:strand:+ start:543 stop:863 length:321 start_codon:yes stop_codon:yes gene_type:complete